MRWMKRIAVETLDTGHDNIITTTHLATVAPVEP